MKRNFKKPSKTVNERTVLMNKALEILISSSGAEKVRVQNAIQTISEQNEKIKKLENFKNTVILFLTECSNKNRFDYQTLLSAIKDYDISDRNLEDIISEKTNENNKMLLDDSSLRSIENVFPQKNISIHERSTLHSNLSISSKISYNALFNKSGLSFCHGTPEKNKKDTRYKLNHVMEESQVFKQRCNNCCKQDNKSVMYKCSTCNVYIHDTCSKVGLCIPLKKMTQIKCLNDLCTDNSLPMVPNVYLALMDRIHKDGLETENLYTSHGKDKEVKELFHKLMEGKVKYLIKYDISIVSNVFLMLLQNLRDTLLPTLALTKLRAFVANNESKHWMAIAKCLMDLPNRDTLIYIIIHLKIVSGHPRCKFNSERLARLFTPFLVENKSNAMSSIDIITMLIDMDIVFYENYFMVKVDFFGLHLKELNVSTTKRLYPSIILEN